MDRIKPGQSFFLSLTSSIKILKVLLAVLFLLAIISFSYYFYNSRPNISPPIFYNQTSIVNIFNITDYGKPDLTPKELWEVNKNVAHQPYMDMNFAKDCGTPGSHDVLFNIMKFWINFTATHDIPWWITYGSLIGALRHKDMIPWDSDIDLAVPFQYEPLIRNLSTSRKAISSKKVNIVVRPGAHCPYNGDRLDCSGNKVTSQVDGCAFCGPLARLFYTSYKRIDIYLMDIKFRKGYLKVLDEGIFEYSTESPAFPIDWIFPLRNCSFMGFTLQCPRQSEVYLKDYYKDISSFYECRKQEWVKIK